MLAGRERLRAKLSYTNVGFALAPASFTISELRDLYSAALGYRVAATNLRRVLERRGVIEPTGERRDSGPGRRPAGGGVPVRLERARRDGSVRGAAPARPGPGGPPSPGQASARQPLPGSTSRASSIVVKAGKLSSRR